MMSSKRHKNSVLINVPPFHFSTKFTQFFLWSHIFFQIVVGELRFCLPQYGPQRMKDTDCPGGFVFKEPVINPDCRYYAKTGDHVGKVLTAPTDFCAENTDRVIDNEGDDLDDVTTLTYFLWEEYDAANETKGTFNPENVCQDDCLAEWEDPHAVVDEDPIPDDFDVSKVSASDMKELKKMNKAMFLRLLMDDDDEDDVLLKPYAGAFGPTAPPVGPPPTAETPSTTTPDPKKSMQGRGLRIGRDASGAQVNGSSTGPGGTLPPRPRKSTKHGPITADLGLSFLTKAIHDSTTLNVIKILSKSMRIILGACSPFIPEDFLEQVLKGMIYISRKMEHTFLDLAPDLYKRIKRTLDHCGLKRTQEFALNGSRCDELSAVEGIYFTKAKEYWPHRLSGWSFRWGRWHPLLDAAWSVIDFVHSYCFESFMQDMMMLHIYEMSLEGLFSEKIQNMWRVAPTVNNDKFWNNLLQTYDLNITMRNLDACQEAARRQSPFWKKLPRPFLTLPEIMKPPPAPALNVPVAKGWNKTMEQYWERYDSLGGFPKISESFGKCFDEAHLEVEADMIDALKQKCP